MNSYKARVSLNQSAGESEYYKSAIFLLSARLVTCSINIKVPFASLKSVLRTSILGCRNGHFAFSILDHMILPLFSILKPMICSFAFLASFSTS